MKILIDSINNYTFLIYQNVSVVKWIGSTIINAKVDFPDLTHMMMAGHPLSRIHLQGKIEIPVLYSPARAQLKCFYITHTHKANLRFIL